MNTNFDSEMIDYLETHFECVSFIINNANDNENGEGTGVIQLVQMMQGIGGLYELAQQWATEFHELHKGREWDGEFFDEIEKFLEDKNNQKTVTNVEEIHPGIVAVTIEHNKKD